MKELPRYEGEGDEALGRHGDAWLYRASEEEPWSLYIDRQRGKEPLRIKMAKRCVCHPTTGPCDSAVNDTAARILRGDHPDIYKP